MFLFGGSGTVPDLPVVFAEKFRLSYITVLSAVILLLLAMLKINGKTAMIVSILTALPICIFVQDTSVWELPHMMIAGYTAENAEAAGILNGGGIASMRIYLVSCLFVPVRSEN